MPTARLTALAEQDLIDIWRFTAERWTEDQADAYLDAIGEAIHHLELHPEAGVNRDNVREGYPALFVNSHAIYYRPMPSGPQVVRVLHERMDPERHLLGSI